MSTQEAITVNTEVEAVKPEVKKAAKPKKAAKTKSTKSVKAKTAKTKVKTQPKRKVREKWSHATISKPEKGIPIPSRADDPNGIAGRAKALKLNESFFVADRATREVSPRLSLLHKSTKLRFTVRAMDGGVRVWRIK